MESLTLCIFTNMIHHQELGQPIFNRKKKGEKGHSCKYDVPWAVIKDLGIQSFGWPTFNIYINGEKSWLSIFTNMITHKQLSESLECKALASHISIEKKRWQKVNPAHIHKYDMHTQWSNSGNLRPLHNVCQTSSISICPMKALKNMTCWKLVSQFPIIFILLQAKLHHIQGSCLTK